MTIQYDNGADGRSARGPIRRIVIDWVSDDATGAVSGTTRKISGELLKAVTDPGSAAPTDNYDIAITDPEGADVLAGCANTLQNRHTSTTQAVELLLTDGTAGIAARPVVCSPLTVAVTNAGNSKAGRIVLYYRM